MPTLSAAEAKRWLRLTKQSLLKLDSVYPMACRSSELPLIDIPQTSRFRILVKLVDAGLIRKIDSKPNKYAGCREQIHKAVANEKMITSVLWASADDEVQQELATVASTETADPVDEADSTSQEVAIALPPQIEGLNAPPAGSSQEVINQWIFTMLHAQTVNLIYIRDQVDKLVKGLGA